MMKFKNKQEKIKALIEMGRTGIDKPRLIAVKGGISHLGKTEILKGMSWQKQ